MKKEHKLLKLRHMASCALIALAGLSACSSVEEDSVSSAGKQMQFTTGITVMKSVGSQLPAGSQIGIFISEDAAKPSMSYDQNLLYTADGSGKLTGNVQVFPLNGNKVKISAYYPYKNTADNEGIFTVAGDQTNNDSIYASDLLYHDEITTNSNPITLTFKHKLSQILYELVPGSGNPDLTNAKVSILNANTSIGFNRTTGALGETSQKKEIALSTKGGIIVPQTIAAGTQFIKITLKSGEELIYTPEEAIAIESNKSYTFKLNLNLNFSEATSIETKVVEWGEGGTIIGDAEGNTVNKLLPVKYMDWYTVQNAPISNDTAKVIFVYDNLKRVSSLEYTRQKFNNELIIEDIQTNITLTYDSQSKLIGSNVANKYVTHDPSHDPVDIITRKNVTYTYDYSVAGQIKIGKTEEGSSPDSYIIYIDNEGRLLSSLYSYDINGNKINAGEEYDNKKNPLLNVNLPRWYAQDSYILSGLATGGKNNMIKRGQDEIYDTTNYNTEGYMTAQFYFPQNSGTRFYRTIEYKRWNE